MAGHYPYNIPSLHQQDAAFPAVLAGLDLNANIQAATPVDPQDLKSARAAAQMVRGANEGGNMAITSAMVATAELRTTAIEAALVAAAYTPVHIGIALQNIQAQLALLAPALVSLQNIQTEVNRMAPVLVSVQNIRVITSNQHLRAPVFNYRPLFKCVAGSGLAKAQNLRPNSVSPATLTALPVNNSPVGSVPQVFPPVLSAASHLDLLKLIIFYNEDFGIVLGEDLRFRTDKVRLFLTTV